MKLLSREEQQTDTSMQKRKHERRSSDQCVSEINGQTYPVMNWSQGGVLLFADDRVFGTDEDIELVMKFRVHDRIVTTSQKGNIIRKGAQRVAIQFHNLTENVKRTFQEVIDDTITREFADSQI